MEKKVSVINIEEKIGKTVGKRKPPSDPFSKSDYSVEQWESWQKALPVKMPRRGVFRFRSHQEADEWWTKETAPKKNH